MKKLLMLAVMFLVGTHSATAQDDVSEIRSLIEQKYQKQNACDASYADDYVTEDATELLPNDLTPSRKDSPESVDDFRSLCEAGGSYDNEVQFHSIDLVSEDVALVIGHGHLRVLDPAGQPEIDGKYSFSEVLVRTEDGWRVRHLHVAPIVPGMPTNARQE